MDVILQSFSKSEKLFVLFAMLTGFLISSEYAITRPSSHALFITVFSSSALPWLWLATVPLNLVAISLYNRFLPRFGPLKMYAAVSLLVITINSCAFFVLPIFPEYIFLQCAWKDIYILLMFKQMWSMIHTTIEATRAKYLYGLIFAMGTVGACIGSAIPGLFAVSIGSETLFLFTLPIYAVQFAAYRLALQRSLVPKQSFPAAPQSLPQVFQNRTLVGILALIVLMQVSIGLMDYRFNLHLETSILEKDLRTAYCGFVFGWMNALNLGLQAVGSFLFIRFLGLKRVHLLIPILVGLSTFSLWMMPTFAVVSSAYIFMKALDLSLFSVSREMLYIPLNLDAKFRAKAVIDVFAYRSSKALVSLLILALQLFAGVYLMPLMNSLSLVIFALWIGVVVWLLYPKTQVKQAGP